MATTTGNSYVDVAGMLEKYPVVLIAESFDESAGRWHSIRKIISNLGVNEATEMVVLALDTRSFDGHAIAQHVAKTTGYSNAPVLFASGGCV